MKYVQIKSNRYVTLYKWQTEVDGGIQVVYIVRYLNVGCNVVENIFTKIRVSMFNHLRFKYNTKNKSCLFYFCFFLKTKNEGFTI